MMLSELIVRNFAIIDRLRVEFGPGFNVLTGETGAGKSILIGALELLLGGRAKADMIRTGEEEASVQAIFEPVHEAFAEAMREADIPVEPELNLRRTLNRHGKNRIYVNGVRVTLSQWQPLGEALVAIYGQHEHQSLLKTEKHLALLDRFANSEPLLASYRAVYDACQMLEKRLASLDTDERERQQRIDLLTYQAEEIRQADFAVGEEKALTEEQAMLANGERLRDVTQTGYRRLYAEGGAVIETLDAVASALDKVQGISPDLDAARESLRSAQYQVEDASHVLCDYESRLDFDPARQDEVESRLALLQRLQRKYAPDIEGLIAALHAMEEELSALEHCDQNRAQWAEELAAKQVELAGEAERLTAHRTAATQELQRRVEAELADLGMTKAAFSVRLLSTEPQATGAETAEFFLTANPGEEARPLARVASGGELSRIMLALKRAVPENANAAMAVFDEVDAGIGGVTATMVGAKLRSVAEQGQVVCITHLAQVASFAQRHYRIEKRTVDDRTQTSVRVLQGEERVEEMARLLGGSHVTERTLEHAREMIDNAGQGPLNPPEASS